MEKTKIFTSSIYEQELEKFNSSRLHSRLAEKFRIKPYYEKHQKTKILALIFSYFLNVLSISTAFYFLYSLLVGLTGKILAIILVLVLLIFLEQFKRILLSSIAQRYYQFIKISTFGALLALLVFSLSAFFSYKGANLAFKSFSSTPSLINTDSIQNAYTAKIDSLGARQKELLNIKYKGTTTRTAAKTAGKVQEELLMLQNEKQEELKIARLANEEKLLSFTDSTQSKGFYFALLALIFDLSLVLCLFYCELYDFRSLAEFGEVATTAAVPPHETSTKFTHKKGNCLNCNSSFEKTVPNKKYCSESCRIEAYEERTGKKLKYKPKS